MVVLRGSMVMNLWSKSRATVVPEEQNMLAPT